MTNAKAIENIIISNKVYKWWEYLKECLGVDENVIKNIGGYNLTHDELYDWMFDNGYGEEFWSYPFGDLINLVEMANDDWEHHCVIVVCNGIGKFYEVDDDLMERKEN